MARGFLQTKVIVNTTNPFVTGCWLFRGQDTETWVEFRYERLQDFCYRCGRIGHVNTECTFEPSRGDTAGFREWTKMALVRDVMAPNRALTLGMGERRYAGAIRRARKGEGSSRRHVHDSPYQEAGGSILVRDSKVI